MPTHKDFYDAVSNTSINADTINLNVDGVETKLDTATGLLTTLSADTALIKADMANGVSVSGTVTANTGLAPLTDTQLRATSVPVSLASVPTHGVTGTFFQATQPISGTVTANTGLTQPLTDTQLRATALPVSLSSLPALTAGTAQIGVVAITQSTASAVTSFTSLTSATLIASNASRKMLTIQNVGAGILYVLFGSGTASASNFSVQMNSGDFYENNYYSGQMNAIFATAGTAYVTSLT